MVDEDTLKKIQKKLQEEIDTIGYFMQEEMETGNEDTLYRQAKLFVFAKSIQTNLQSAFFWFNDDITEKFVNSFLNEKNFVEKLYTHLYENSGTELDLFMDRMVLLDNIKFYLK